MQESCIALAQMTRTTLAVNELKKNNIPFIVILTNPTTGGVTASWAMLGDIIISEASAMVAFAAALGPENMAGIVDKLGEGMGLDGIDEQLQPLVAALTNFDPVGDVASAISMLVNALRTTTN